MLRWFVALALLLPIAWRPEFAVAVDPLEDQSFADEPQIDNEAQDEESDNDESSDDKDDESSDQKEEESDKDEPSDEDEATKEKAETDEEPADDGKSEDAKEEKQDEEKQPVDEKASEAKATDEKESEKAAEKKPADDKKPAEEKKPEEKKPETHKVETKKLTIEAEVEGVFVAKEAEEVPLRPDVWTSFKVLEAVPHGKRVRKGDVLVKFDPKEFDEALAEKQLAQRVGELTLMAAEEEFPRLEKSVDLTYEMAERDYQQAVDEYERYQKTMRTISEKMAKYFLSSAEQDLDNAREELTQLEKMYQADELTEETEEIVLRRQKFQVQAAEFFMEYSKINHDYTMDVSIPERDKMLSTAVEQAKIAFDRAKMAKSLGLNTQRYELQALRESRERSVESHAKLEADRALMTLKSPADGIAYYGRCVNGRWADVSSLEQKLIPFGVITPGSVVMTIVKDRPMFVETSIGEKELPTVKKGQSATLTPLADEEVELKGEVAEVGDVPGGGNKFAVKLEVDAEDAPEWLMPGMSVKAKIKTYEAEKVVVVPADLVQSNEDEPKKKYVMLQIEDDEKPVRREIKLGKKKDKEVEVVKGLEAGDVIVKGAKDGEEKEGEAEEKEEKQEEKEE